MRRVVGNVADLIEVSGCQLPGLGGKVDVVAVVHLGQVVEAAGLHSQTSVDVTSRGQTDLSVMQQNILLRQGMWLLPLLLACITSASCPWQSPQQMPSLLCYTKVHMQLSQMPLLTQKHSTCFRKQWAQSVREI